MQQQNPRLPPHTLLVSYSTTSCTLTVVTPMGETTTTHFTHWDRKETLLIYIFTAHEICSRPWEKGRERVREGHWK